MTSNTLKVVTEEIQSSLCMVTEEITKEESMKIPQYYIPQYYYPHCEGN